jgi:hypothetical protein
MRDASVPFIWVTAKLISQIRSHQFRTAYHQPNYKAQMFYAFLMTSIFYI